MRLLIVCAGMLAVQGCVAAPYQEAVPPGELLPITADYRDRIRAWADRRQAGPAPLRGALASDPLLIRDSSGRLLWLVCLDLDPARREPPGLRPRLQAFGFAPNFVTAPLERSGSSLNWEYCTERPLLWRPFEPERPARRRLRRG